jgi:predicted MPP superfamily phosphohydrolase
MALADPIPAQPITRRRFLITSLGAAGGLAFYSGEIERHWVEVTRRDIHLPALPAAFDGFTIVQLSDIHLDEFTEPFLLRHAIGQVNRLRPDAVFLTGDYVSFGVAPRKFAIETAWQCAGMLKDLECKHRYSILGNHDAMLGEDVVTEALISNGIPVLKNTFVPIERAGDRIWLAGLDDPLFGHPDPNAAIPASIRNVPNEPVVVLCHAPDYADTLLSQPAGRSVHLMLSGHTHGGQVRLPLMGAVNLPPMGRKYIDGWFRLGGMQLYVNRGIGTVGVPFRFNCPPEITLLTLRKA